MDEFRSYQEGISCCRRYATEAKNVAGNHLDIRTEYAGFTWICRQSPSPPGPGGISALLFFASSGIANIAAAGR